VNKALHRLLYITVTATNTNQRSTLEAMPILPRDHLNNNVSLSDINGWLRATYTANGSAFKEAAYHSL